MQVRGRIGGDVGYVRDQLPGDAVMSQLQFETNATNGNSTLTVSSILGGVVNRTTVGAPYTDTLPTVDQIVAAAPQLSAGDSFSFLFRNTIAQACTLAAGTGFTLGATVDVAASKCREYLVTMNATKRTRTFSATTTNASKVFSNVAAADLKELQPGMAVTGTGVGASAKIVAVNEAAGTFTVDVDSTATANNIGVTANPTATILGVRSADI